MNFDLPFIPERSAKPRENGLTMMMDKGLSIREAEDFISSSGQITDIVKLGFGTSHITNDLKEKSNYTVKQTYEFILVAPFLKPLLLGVCSKIIVKS